MPTVDVLQAMNVATVAMPANTAFASTLKGNRPMLFAGSPDDNI